MKAKVDFSLPNGLTKVSALFLRGLPLLLTIPFTSTLDTAIMPDPYRGPYTSSDPQAGECQLYIFVLLIPLCF